MKKLFLLIPLFVFSLLANATERRIGSSTTNIISATIEAATSGDVIILTDEGPYVNAYGVGYHELNKNLTIKADEGVTPVVNIEVPFRITNGATVKFIGIKFDGSSIDHYDFLFRYYSTDATNLEFEDCEFTSIGKYIFDIYKDKNANSLVIKNCNFHDASSRGILVRGTIGEINISGSEFSNFTGYPIIHNYETGSIGKIKISDSEFKNNSKYLINGEATTHADSCIITNCYFHNNARSAIFFNASSVEGTETCDGVIVKNTTFANNDMSASDGSVIEVRNYGSTVASNIEVTVDHCTFYNNPTSADGYAGIRSYKSTKLNVTNCIFAHPTSYAKCATYCYGGNVTNCLAYNLTSGTNGHHSGPTLTGNFTADPLFRDAANGDYTLRMGSPARGVATDASDLGDPRWAGELEPISTDFATPLVLEAADASRNEYYTLDANNYLKSANPSTVTTEYGIATWLIHANGPASVQTTLNMSSESLYGHTYKVAIYNSSDVKIGEVGESGWSDVKTDIPLTGSIYLTEAGDYTVRLSNICNGSVATIQGITLSYTGGAIKDIPGTLTAADAVFSSKGSRADGMITFSTYADQWVKWNAETSGSGPQKYAVTLNINNPTAYGHRFTVSFYLNESESPVATLTESSWNETYGTPLAISMGDALLAGGNTYVVKVTNAENGAQPKIISAGLVAAGGAMQNIPCAITLSDAILSSRAYIDGDGLHFTDADHLGTISDEWAKWNIHAASEGVYTFTAHCSSTNWSNLTIKVLDTDENELYSYTPEYTYNQADKEITSPEWILTAGDYILKLSNPANHSNGYLLSLAAAKGDIIVLDENATDYSVINANDGVNTKKIALKRSFKAGMYNTICLPFSDWVSSLELVFGTGYELWELNTAELDGDVLNLDFTQVTGEFGHGRPYLIKPSKDVTNPIFGTGHTMNKSTSYNIKNGTNANFVGSFIKYTIPAGEDNLFLGANDKLYFSNEATVSKGMRAYFQIHDAPAGVIQRARIVQQGEVVTELELIDGEWVDARINANDVIKTIENGQLVIIKNGAYYNAFGVKVK